MPETKKLDTQDIAVITDAIRLSKTNFVELYAELGYNKIFVGLNWHSIRTSSKGQEMFLKLYPQGKDRSQPLSFISDIKAEAELRQQGINDTPQVETKQIQVDMKDKKKAKSEAKAEAKLQPKHPLDVTVPTSPVPSELIGAKVSFTKKGDDTAHTGRVLKTFVAKDNKEYAKIRLDDYSTCLKQVTSLTVVKE